MQCATHGQSVAVGPGVRCNTLLAEEEVLGGQLPTGPDHEPQQAQQVSEEGERCSEQVG